jgi:hypothetical protein
MRVRPTQPANAESLTRWHFNQQRCFSRTNGARVLTGFDDFVARNLQQPAVRRKRDGFLLQDGVDDDPFKLGGLDGSYVYRR